MSLLQAPIRPVRYDCDTVLSILGNLKVNDNEMPSNVKTTSRGNICLVSPEEATVELRIMEALHKNLRKLVGHSGALLDRDRLCPADKAAIQQLGDFKKQHKAQVAILKKIYEELEIEETYEDLEDLDKLIREAQPLGRQYETYLDVVDTIDGINDRTGDVLSTLSFESNRLYLRGEDRSFRNQKVSPKGWWRKSRPVAEILFFWEESAAAILDTTKIPLALSKKTKDLLGAGTGFLGNFKAVVERMPDPVQGKIITMADQAIQQTQIDIAHIAPYQELQEMIPDMPVIEGLRLNNFTIYAWALMQEQTYVPYSKKPVAGGSGCPFHRKLA